jgi:hypothetical protein
MKAQPLFIALHLLSKAEGQRYEYPESPVHCSETDSCTSLCRISLCTTDRELKEESTIWGNHIPFVGVITPQGHGEETYTKDERNSLRWVSSQRGHLH